MAPGTQGGARTILVTVGTTKFDDLVAAVDSDAFAEAALARGYTHVRVQRGNGAYTPHNLLGSGSDSGVSKRGLEVSFFQYTPSLRDDIESAALVISHAGSGSIFEALSYGRPLVVVPNPALMDNHQAELGTHLSQLGHLVCSTPGELATTVRNFDASKIKPYTVDGSASAAAGIASKIDKAVFAG